MGSSTRSNLLGLTGGIGSGKSTVLAMFADLGAATIDADGVVHDLYAAGGELAARLQRRWGDAVVASGGGVDRRAVADLVFRDKAELAWLSGLVHPLVRERIAAFAAAHADVCVAAVPLLFEVGWGGDFRRTMAVWCDPSTQLARLRRRGWSDDEIRSRTSSQIDMDRKLELADWGIVNTGSRDWLREQCRRTWLRWSSSGT